MKRIIIYLLLLSTLFSCSFSGRLSKRYKRIKIIESAEVINDKISVGVYTIESKNKKTPDKNIFNLSPKGQSALITELSKKDSSSTLVLKSIRQSIQAKNSNAKKVIDYSRIEKRLIISVSNNGVMPADRISKINVELNFGGNVKLLSCNNLTTDFETVDLAKLNYSASQNSEVNGNVSASTNKEVLKEAKTNSEISNKTTSNLGYGVIGKLAANRSFSEEVLLKRRIVSLNAAITKNRLSLYQDGISGIDLTGNIIADIVLEVEDLKVEKVYSFTGLTNNSLTNNPEKIKVNTNLMVVPDLNKDISVQVSFSANYREVYKNHETVTESDDKVKLYYGKVSNEDQEVIIPLKSLSKKLWKLSFQDLRTKLPVQIKSPAATGPGDLVFNSFEEAEKFTIWLKLKFNSAKKSLIVGKSKHVVFVPPGFTDIQKIEILPYR